ncbi:MAG TPA: NADH-quinone oxidoreductase subunit G, partial [Actinomycetota bacterium]|nr:NADH-quinone oxidoreductase subunit G [Actinomycetota bacterium]
MSVGMVSLTIDGKEVTVPKGTLLIRAAEQVGVEIPRFCDHPYLQPAGACRQCYVQIEGQPKLATSCTVAVAPGMVVNTQNTSRPVQQAQVANLEFLLLNHPLDCPVCDRGGECPLQDQALAFGPGESRFTEAKRTYPKPVPMSPLVGLDRERCVLCARCTRFCDQISGDRFLELFARGAGERVSIAAGEDLRSPFSGNTIQICPVGALTATPYRFVARPFDLTSADSVCRHCSAGCAVRVDQRRGEVVRVLARENPNVNDAWICDKGRFAFGHDDAPGRITTPLVRDHGLEPTSFGEALTAVADACRGARVGVLAGGRLLDEDAYALSKLARLVLRSNDLDHRRAAHGGAAELVAAAGAEAVTYRDLEHASVIVVAGLDAEQEVPILHLRLRKAAGAGATVVVVATRRTRLHDVAEHILVAPGREAATLAQLAGAAAADTPAARLVGELAAAGGNAFVLAGARLAEHEGAADAALALARAHGARFAWIARRAGDHGALRAGIHPAMGPGGRRLHDAEDRAEIEAVWGPLMTSEPGRDGIEILRAAAEHELDVLYLVGVDPLRDAPDAALARRALQNVGTVVVQSLELGDLAPFASVFLPAASWLERDGHVSDWEGRSQRVTPLRRSAGISRPDWEIFAGLAAASGTDLGFETLEELHEEMARLWAPRVVAVEPAAASSTTPATEGLTLCTYPLLIDEGRMSEGAEELKATLQDPAFAEMHPADAAAHGLADGLGVRLRTAAGEAVVPLRVTEHIAPGTVFVP